MYRCPWCGKRFKRFCDLVKHVKRVHASYANCCPACGKCYSSLRGLLTHLSSACANDVYHALLFLACTSSQHGPRGDGRRAAVKLVAKLLRC